ncbi:MAG: LPS export ABC transporter periplasmic protein LptC [Bacteroidia bacterium]|nr:LPS export ABC transporter periplasmic protein LptC [Bacteroidia bacterium]
MLKSFLFLGAVLLLCSCSNRDTENYRSRKTDSVNTKETAEDVTIEYTDSGLLRAKVLSPLMIGMKKAVNPYIEMPKGIKVNFYNPQGAVESYLTAEYAISFTEKKKIIVRRNVEVLNVKGDTMLTEELIWNQKTGRITTDKFVRIKTKTQIISGEGMESDQSFSDWEIRKVTGTIYKGGSN